MTKICKLKKQQQHKNIPGPTDKTKQLCYHLHIDLWIHPTILEFYWVGGKEYGNERVRIRTDFIETELVQDCSGSSETTPWKSVQR